MHTREKALNTELALRKKMYKPESCIIFVHTYVHK